MSEWLICVAWVFTLFVAYHFGFEEGHKIGRVGERCEWLKSGWKDKDGDAE